MLKKCDYKVSYGLIEMLIGLTGLKKQEVWSEIVDAANVCFTRMDKKNLEESWRWFKFPNTEVRMKIKILNDWYRHDQYPGMYSKPSSKTQYYAEVTFSPNDTERFTSDQVEEFLVEELLLES